MDDLEVYHAALDAADAVSATTQRPAFSKNRELRDQLNSACGKVAAHIAEGYGQLTDRHFAHYLGIARGSCNETRTHLVLAQAQHLVTPEECRDLCARYISIGKRLTRLIQHLRRSNRDARG